ncbi:MAG: BNR-4 repeat-containing protein [Planctomycetes bacterium]|nr:BNR-4 repeat-containing protein [Planctomycetota bacterium]
MGLAAVSLAFAFVSAADERDVDLLFGGCGGVYFLAEPGELIIDIEKRDRNVRGAYAELRAILAGPDRRVLGEVAIPDDGRPRGSGMGPRQRARLSTRVDHKGVFALDITVSQDRYGQEIVWGFRTNCAKYLIETSRGHKDERHQEPIVLASPGRPADVCFAPRPEALVIDVSRLPSGIDALEVLDRDGARIRTLEVKDGRASATIPAGVHRDAAPWRLRLPSAQATVEIDGVTRWDRGDPNPDICCWTPDPRSWFPFLDYRWLLTPYSRKVYGPPESEGEIRFQVRSSAAREETIRLAIEYSGEAWPAHLSQTRVSLGPGKAAPIAIRYAIPPAGETRVCRIRATPENAPEFSTYSTLACLAGEAPAAKPLDMPIVLAPYRHENELFGYLPSYPVGNQPYFDLQNHPVVRAGGGIAMRRDAGWEETDLAFGALSTKIAFDGDGDMYLLGRDGSRASLLHSRDGGRTFASHPVPGRPGTFDIEQFSGHNAPDGPPPFVRFVQTSRDPKLIWRRLNDLHLFVPRKVDGRIEIGDPILISKVSIGLSAHSGIPSSVVSRGTKVHVAWGEATDPAERVPGVPTFVATYDRKTGKLGAPARVGYGPPANDVHNSPSITMDSRGFLHVLVGTHGRPFPYARSLRPNDAAGGWTEPALAGEGLNQTYVGFVCGKDDTLHTVFRLWRSGGPFPHSTYATLAHMRKRPGEPWEPPRILVVPPFSEYSVFYHRLTIDREGRLFLSYEYWSTYWFYRIDHAGSRRALLMSPDGGDTWRLAGAF